MVKQIDNYAELSSSAKDISRQLEELSDKLRHFAHQLLNITPQLEKGLVTTAAEEAKFVAGVLGLGKAARQLTVDVATLNHWRRGKGPNEENRKKLHTLCEELREKHHNR